jgi:alpha-glucosidase
MRYQLMPYLYTLAWTANQEGAPFMRPMFWSDPGDASLWEIADQYFLGPDLLIAPVLEPNNTEREVALPAGSWFDLWSDVQYEGGSVQAIPTELSMIPVFIRAGAILPLEGDDNTLELHLYLPGQGDLFGELYSDAGDGYAEFRVDRFEGKRQGNRVQLNWQTQGSYPWPFTTLQIHVHGAEVQRLAIDGEDFQGDPKHDLPGLFKTLEITLK